MATVGFADLVRLIEVNRLLGERQLEQLKQQADKAIDPKVLLKKLLEKGKITRWQAKQLMQGNERLKIGNMILTDEVSESNLGQLYHARQIGLERPVCLLVLSEEFQDDEELLARFGERIGSFSNVQHDALVRPLEIEKQDDVIVMAMDHFEGIDLFDRVKDQGPLSKHQTVNLVKRLIDFLDELHNQGVVHGELTPGSIVTDGDEEERVLCFDPTPADDAEKSEHIDYFLSTNAEETPDDTSIDLFSVGRIGLFAMTGDFPDEEYIQEHKSPLVTLFSRMSSTDDSQITSTAKVNKLLDRWLELNVEQEPDELTALDDGIGLSSDDGIGLSSDDYQTDGDDIGNLNFGVDFAQSRVQDRLKKSRGSASTVVAEAPAKKGESTESSDETAEPKKKSSKGLLIGAGVGALVMVMLCAGVATGIWYAISSASNEVDRVAQELKANMDNVVPADAGKTADAKDDSAASKDTEGTKSSLATSKIDTKGATKDEVENKDTAKDDAAKQEDKGEPKVDPKDGSTDPKGTETNAKPPAVEPEKDPKAPAKSDDPKVAVNTETDPKTAKPDTPEKDKPAPKPVAKKVFELPAILPVPDPGTSAEPGQNFDKEVTLGKVRLQPGEYFALDLHGAAYAHTDSSKFDLKEIAAEQRSWQIRFIPNIKNETTTQVIADFKLDGEDLKFQWRPEALKVPAAAYFKNCLVGFKTGTALQFAAMRKPTKIEPIILKKGLLIGKVNVEIENMPEVDYVMVEFLVPEKKFPGHKFVPEKVISAVRGETAMVLGEASHEYFATSFKSRGSNKLTISASSQILLAKEQYEKPIAKEKLPDALNSWKNELKGTTDYLAQYAKLPKPEQDKNKGFQQRATAYKQQCSENIARLEALTKIMGSLEDGEIPVRIFFQAGDYEVDLATPTGNPVKKANEQ